MIKYLLIKPAKLCRWMSTKEKLRTLVMFDIEPDLLDERVIRLDINVVFNHIPVRKGFAQKADFYIGTTGAEIFTEFDEGSIRHFTEQTSFNVNYTNTVKHNRKSSVSIKPDIDTKTDQEKAKVGAGSISLEKGADRTFTSAFTNKERILIPVHMGSLLRWVITLPRGEKAIRDFLLGNIYLFVVCSWDVSGDTFGCGRVGVRPSDVRFFDDERRALSKRKSLLMLCELWLKGIHIHNNKGITTSFKVV